MASRQNKKRKGRNPLPRERTVTTLTDGVDGPFSHSSPDDPAMPPGFPPPIPPPANTSAMPPGSFPLQSFASNFLYPQYPHIVPPNFPSTVAPFGPLPHQPMPSPSVLPSAPVLPPGQNDLKILERLKEVIKNNQHEIYRPVPQPAALASIYLGPPAQSQPTTAFAPPVVPPHPEQ
ncbi:uncharacterized protein BXZ73DRAFT_16161, partial [Epithele typhae]|uniref:uncharacterized protein n=1 Tax=Epithele typhae TaxID=378194 RepID=UPI002007EEA2